MSIGKVAALVGLTTATINFYVSDGLLPPPRKLSRTRAAYSPRHLRVLRLIQKMQKGGASLAQIKSAFAGVGTDDAGLEKLEDIGFFQPLQPPQTDVDRAPIEHFDPVRLAEFARRADVTPAFVERLVRAGIVKPGTADRFDARDLLAVRTLKLLGVDATNVDARFAPIVEFVRTETPKVLAQMHVRRRELRARTLRFSHLVEDYGRLIGYLIERTATQNDPAWRERLFEPDKSSGTSS